MQGYSKKQTSFLTPVMFGIAHVHHLVEMVKFQGAELLSATAAVSTPSQAVYSGVPNSCTHDCWHQAIKHVQVAVKTTSHMLCRWHSSFCIQQCLDGMPHIFFSAQVIWQEQWPCMLSAIG